MCYDVVSAEEEGYQTCDLTNIESVAKINVNVDYIYMFAGLTGTYAGFDKAQTYVNINEMSLLNLLNYVRYSGYRPRIIFPSTRLVYKGSEQALAEDAEKEAKTIYAVNKMACEQILSAYRNSFDISYTIFRIGVPFGNMFSNDYSFGTIGFFIRQARNNGKITLYGDGSVKRTFTSMCNLSMQLVEAGMKDAADGEIYNIGGCTYSLCEAATYIANYYKAEVAFVPWPECDLKIESGSTFFDTSKIESLLGHVNYDSLKVLFE